MHKNMACASANTKTGLNELVYTDCFSFGSLSSTIAPNPRSNGM